MGLKILKIDSNDYNSSDPNATLAYFGNASSYSIVPFKPKQDPMNGWAFPIVTGHKYKFHWEYGLDFMTMEISLSPRWQPADKNLNIMFNFTDVRVRVDVMTGGDTIPNMTLVNKTLLAPQTLQTGDNVVYNDTATREILLLINGKNATRNTIFMQGYRCNGPCMAAITD